MIGNSRRNYIVEPDVNDVPNLDVATYAARIQRGTKPMTIVRAIFLLMCVVDVTSLGAAQTLERPVAIVFFTEWSALLDADAQKAIRESARAIAGENKPVLVTGYADLSGGGESNRLLSGLRAQIVIDQLVSDGVPAARISRVDHGATPDTGVPTESRRVVITFIVPK